jgi:hypothetical protein
MWLSMHASHTSVYVPLLLAMVSREGSMVGLAPGLTQNSLTRLDRGTGFFQAARMRCTPDPQHPSPCAHATLPLSQLRHATPDLMLTGFVFNTAQLEFVSSIERIRQAQETWEAEGEVLVRNATAAYVSGSLGLATLTHMCNTLAAESIRAWWDLSDELMLKYGVTTKLAYPVWWLRSPAVNFTGGPPPSPPVPPLDVTLVSAGAAHL